MATFWFIFQMMVNEGYNAILREIDLMRLANIGTEVQSHSAVKSALCNNC
jgi:hypothetical protein